MHTVMYGGNDFSVSTPRSPQSIQLNFLFCEYVGPKYTVFPTISGTYCKYFASGNPKYIPANCYFMMGDNRFNSLDLRHAYEHEEKALSSDDPLSVTYYSRMAPQYINKKYIVGKPVFRFWPLGRLGKV